jgi:hypothetical protein
MTINQKRFTTYKSLSPVLRTQTTCHHLHQPQITECVPSAGEEEHGGFDLVQVLIPKRRFALCANVSETLPPFEFRVYD